jgi:hypothetical protein
MEIRRTSVPLSIRALSVSAARNLQPLEPMASPTFTFVEVSPT